MFGAETRLVDKNHSLIGVEKLIFEQMVNMAFRALRKQIAYEPIVGRGLPWDCISLRCSTALWIRPLGQRIQV